MLVRYLFFTLFLLSCCVAQAQNLVLNPSFEDTVACPDMISQISRCLYWTNPWEFSTPDYFNSCNSTNICSVPANNFGYEQAHTGNAYAGIVTSKKSFNYREYIEGQLTHPLVAGKNYCVEFYVSAYDSVGYISDNIGMFFSKEFIEDTCNFCVMPFSPQVENKSSNHLNTRVGWTKVSGSYKAFGGESYLIIGNFRDTAFTTSVYKGWTTIKSNNVSAYYIDDVSVIQCDSMSAIENVGVLNNHLHIDPNPSNGLYKIEADNSILKTEIYNSLGKKILSHSYTNTNEIELNLVSSPSGVYFLYLETKKNQLKVKLIKN